MSLLLILPVLICVAAIFFGCSLMLVSRPLGGVILVVLSYLYGVLLVTVPAIPLGLLVYPADIVFALLLSATILRYAMGKFRPRGTLWLPVGLFTLFFFSLARGLATFGVKQAGVESRGWFYYLVGVLYFSSFRFGPRMRKRVIAVWLTASMALVGIAVFRWLATLAGLSIVAQWESLLVGGDLRVLTAADASFLAVAFFASVFLNMLKLGSQWQRKAFYIFGPALLVLQHRTVWLMMIIGLLWLGLQDVRFRKKIIGALAGIAFVGIILAGFLFTHQSEVLSESLKNSASNDDSFLWRVSGWYQLLFENSARSLLNDSIGQPFGTGFERFVFGARVNVAPHSFYIEAFLRLGFAGLGLLTWLYARGIRRLRSIPMRLSIFAYPGTRFWALILLMQLVYFFTYAAPYEQSILTGVALAGLRLHFRRSLPLPSPSAPLVPAQSA